MQYNNNSHIETIKDVISFFYYLANNRNVNFHPDNDFEEYECLETHKATFSKEECKLFNRLMKECFDICNATGDVDKIYEIGNNILLDRVRKDIV